MSDTNPQYEAKVAKAVKKDRKKFIAGLPINYNSLRLHHRVFKWCIFNLWNYKACNGVWN